MKMQMRRLIGAAAAYNLALGFIPDYVEILMYNATHGSNVLLKWFGSLAVESATIIAGGGIYGHLFTQGACTEADADTGIKPYVGNKTPSVRVPAPSGQGQVVKSIYGDWSAAVDYNSVGTIRSTTVVGTLVRPPTHNGKVFELTTKTGAGTSAPTTWDVAPGESVTDGGSNVWICREEDVVNAGELGITIGATLAGSGQELLVMAFGSDEVLDLGSVA
jgi:hypothetical protein